MEGKEAIVQKITADANAQAAQCTQNAQARADAMKAEAEKAAKTKLEEGRRALETEAQERIERRETLAALDCRKQLLAARRAVIDAALSRALEAACAFPEARYLAVLERLLTQYAGEGDGVRLSAAAPVTEESLRSLKVFSARRLRFLGKDGDFEGGMRLYGATYEADLSFRALIEAQRFELERDIAHMMPAEK